MGNSSAAESGVETAFCTSTLVRRKSVVFRGSSFLSSPCRPSNSGKNVHFLDVCGLCRRPLGRFRDIFMYRGDSAFCSEECRQEQIALDEATEERAGGCWSRRPSHGVHSHAAEPAVA